MTGPHFRDKFVAFMDILGFSSMVNSAEQRGEPALLELLDLCSALENQSHRQTVLQYGPVICPESQYTARDLDYEVTRISDSVIVSAEVSPAGAINIVFHLWSVAFNLLSRGVMLRGSITRGSIYHKEKNFLGSGPHEAIDQEKAVRVFQLPDDDTSTPFIEIDTEVVRYIGKTMDPCTTEVFERLTRTEGDVTAIFPFQLLSRIAGSGSLDLDKTRNNLKAIRSSICTYKAKLESLSPSFNQESNRKSKYYRKFLDEELAECDQIERDIEMGNQPAVKLRHD